MAGRIARTALALALAISVWAPNSFAHPQSPSLAWTVPLQQPQDFGRAAALAAAAITVLAVFLRAILALLRRGAGGRFGTRPSRVRPRFATPAMAGALLALLLWSLPWLSFHDTHHALERGEPACQVAQIVHSQGGGILPQSVALAPPLLAEAVPLSESTPLPSRSAPQPAARSPPV